MLTGGDKPILTLRTVRLEAEQEAMAEDFRRLLLDGITAEDSEVVIGTFSAT